MDAQETRIYTAAIITIVVVGAVIIYFIISIIRQQRKNLDLNRQNILAEITAIERDRTRIAYDLHDDLGPALSSIKLWINIFEFHSTDDKKVIEKLNESIDSVITRIREISFNLMPTALLTAGLDVALREYIDTVKTGDLDISLIFSNTILFSKEASVNIYRIVQEIIHNTIKHAQATELGIFFRSEKNKIIITLKDNGIGFEQKEVLGKGGLGLKSLHGRTQLLSGRMFLDTKKGRGTEFIFEIPF